MKLTKRNYVARHELVHTLKVGLLGLNDEFYAHAAIYKIKQILKRLNEPEEL